MHRFTHAISAGNPPELLHGQKEDQPSLVANDGQMGLLSERLRVNLAEPISSTPLEVLDRALVRLCFFAR